MMGSMNKRINMLERHDVFALEKKEHNLKRAPTVGQLLRNEMIEHNLKKKPTLATVRRAESKEHAEDDKNEYEGMDDMVIEGTSRNRRAATKEYRRAK